MQQRYHIAWYDTFEDAVKAKRAEQRDKPEGHFQVRHKQKGFELVERLQSKEAEHVQDYLQGKTRSHPRRSKKKGRPIRID